MRWIPCQMVTQKAKDGTVYSVRGLGYKISKNLRNGESLQVRLGWAIKIQNIQSDLGLQRTAFPDLCLDGDSCLLLRPIKTNGVKRSG